MPRREDITKVLIIGSGPIVIGQACEFDYSGTQACKALRSLGYKIVLVNSNPATIMTDPGMADATYIEPLTIGALEQIIKIERPDAVLPNLGGQTGLNLTAELNRKGILKKYGVKIIGVQADAIERGEDRIIFKETMNRLGIPMPISEPAYTVEEAEEIVKRLGFPVVVRPAIPWGVPGAASCTILRNCGRFRAGGFPQASSDRSSSSSRLSDGRNWNWKSSGTRRTRRSPCASSKMSMPWGCIPATPTARRPC